MTTQGNPPQGAPDRTLLSLLLTRPAIRKDGTLETWFGQFLQRLVGYVGATGTSTSGTQTSLSEMINQTQAALLSLPGANSADGATLSRLAALENEVPVLPPGPTGIHAPAPLPPFPADGAPSALLDQAFGGAEGMILYRGQYGWAALAPGTAGQTLHTAGAGAIPYWA